MSMTKYGATPAQTSKTASGQPGRKDLAQEAEDEKRKKAEKKDAK